MKYNLGILPGEKIKLSDILVSFSTALDLGGKGYLAHSQRVAYISLNLARALGLDKTRVDRTVIAALLHDIGIKSSEIKLESRKMMPEKKLLDNHCILGSNLLQNINCLSDIPEIVLSHHDKWVGENSSGLSGESIPLSSRIIFISDRVEVLLDKNKYILHQTDRIIEEIRKYSGYLFDPHIVRVFVSLARKESFWLALKVDRFIDILEEWGQDTRIIISMDDLEEIASLFANIIDMKSPFTTRHSVGVATIAAMITHTMDFSLKEQQALRIAGMLHDLGKLVIPESILQKNGSLTESEVRIVRQHSYYTYYILNKIKEIGSIPEWAAYHHERLDGSGYPFHLTGDLISMGSRIMAISDIFQALTENRPYREALSIDKAVNIIKEIVHNDSLDQDVFDVLVSCI